MNFDRFITIIILKIAKRFNLMATYSPHLYWKSILQ